MPGEVYQPARYCGKYNYDDLCDQPGPTLSNGNHHNTSLLPSATSTLSSPLTAVTAISSSLANSYDHWEFNTTRDERSYGLSRGQCDAAFPGLFAEIDRAAQHRKGVKKQIQEEEIDISWAESGAVRATILDQQVIF